MIFSAILAGGVGTRMGNQDRPKQYLYLDKKPIIAHTVEKFLAMPDFEAVIVLCPPAWMQSTKDILEREFGENEKLHVIAGGLTRNQTIMHAIEFIEQNHHVTDDDILVTHDSVRPFVSYRIIKDNIAIMANHSACDTVIPASDTIVESLDGREINSIPDRRTLYQGQTPQSFKIKMLKSLYESLSVQEKETLTDACKIFTLRGHPVALVKGEPYNIKITFPSDLKMANALMGVSQDA